VSTFGDDVTALLDRTREVDIETRSAKGEIHHVTIWIVVVDGAPCVRSYLGAKGRWYRELLARKTGALVVGTRRLPVRPARVRSDELIRAVSAGFRRKYPRSGSSLAAMVRREVLDTTLRLEPAE